MYALLLVAFVDHVHRQLVYVLRAEAAKMDYGGGGLELAVAADRHEDLAVFECVWRLARSARNHLVGNADGAFAEREGGRGDFLCE